MMTLPQPIALEALARRAGASVRGDAAATVSDLAYDSREVTRGSLYFCIAGARADGHDFAAAAVAAGAVALVCERPLDLDVPQIVVPSVRKAMGPMSAAAFGDPSRAITVAGVTGTNGKTTTTFLIEQCFAALGMTTGLLGTVETHIAGAVEPAGRTTPESVDLQRMLARMRAAGVTGATMEVSSHGLAMGRVDGVRYACATFTNLTQDHLDFHETMEDYFAAKAMLFDPSRSGVGAINADDEYGRRLASGTEIEHVTFGLEHEADVRATDVVMGAGGSRFVCVTPAVRVPVSVRLAGPFNVSNALAALATMYALGLDVEKAAAGIEAMPGVPGRFERVDDGEEFTVLVDYAHTPDSVERVLRAAREICRGRLVVVVGCGGDRDRAKRPLMGASAVALADRAILTSDNPRSEEPRAIIAEMEQGARETGRPYEVEVDRRAAIRAAVRDARPGDVIVIAGKGHESGQEFAGHTVPFDDRAVAREEIAAR
ncbi:MAG TPA: UDP-N-acetylmuramoyl-L-alanyl-D-glutamate--2,6-diaminopimelate ligase [Actinomycetota bacterium]|nr:UDP-N-acetylmuramoyl-L-alanyl-D-glutamate--2,6-diaminopimelate ligase [Actinomycetota bacterium]